MIARERELPVDADLLAAVGCLFAAVILFGAGYAIWENIAENLHFVALASSLACYAAAFAVACMGLSRSEHARTAAIAGIIFAFCAQSSNYLFFKVPYYDSDALLFNAYSAQLLTEGIDPYTRSMEPGYRIFGVPEGEATPTVNGGTVFALSYPALSFLVYVPFILLGVSNLLWVNVLGHLAILLILIAASPPKLRPIAPIVLCLDPSYFEYTVGGVTDVLWVPFAMLAAMAWNRRPIAAAAALGAACSFKQTPWLLIPFALVFWFTAARDERRPRALLAPASALAATFVLINLPFIVWHPADWARGVLTPVSGQLVLFGSGIVQLISSGLISAAPLSLSVLSLGVLAVLLVAYALAPRRLAFLPFIAPAISYFFAPRSLQNYFMYWPAVLLAYVFANFAYDRERAKIEAFSRTQLRGAASALGVLVLAAAVAAAHPHRQISVRVLHAWVDPATNGVQRLNLLVRNDIATPQRVHFNVTEQGDGYDYVQWLPKRRQLLPPYSERRITIWAPSPETEADLDATTAVQAVAVDGRKQEYSPAVTFGDAPPKLQNATFATWSYSSPAYPVGWNFDVSDVHRGRIAFATIGGRRAVELRLPPEALSRWRATMVAQLTDARSATLCFWLYPRGDYRGGAVPQQMFGAELRDVLGHEVFVTIDSHRRKAVYYTSHSRVIVVVPGRLGRWNPVTVDLARLHRRYGFALGPTATMLVSAVAVAHGRSIAPLSGYFGGITAAGADASFVSLPVMR